MAEQKVLCCKIGVDSAKDGLRVKHKKTTSSSQLVIRTRCKLQRVFEAYSRKPRRGSYLDSGQRKKSKLDFSNRRRLKDRDQRIARDSITLHLFSLLSLSGLELRNPVEVKVMKKKCNGHVLKYNVSQCFVQG